jgi:hypothetical protein
MITATPCTLPGYRTDFIKKVPTAYYTLRSSIAILTLHGPSMLMYLVLGWYTDEAAGWTIGVLGFDSRRELGISIFTTASTKAPGPIHLLSSEYRGALYLGVKCPRREADHSPPFRGEVKE